MRANLVWTDQVFSQNRKFLLEPDGSVRIHSHFATSARWARAQGKTGNFCWNRTDPFEMTLIFHPNEWNARTRANIIKKTLQRQFFSSLLPSWFHTFVLSFIWARKHDIQVRNQCLDDATVPNFWVETLKYQKFEYAVTCRKFACRVACTTPSPSTHVGQLRRTSTLLLSNPCNLRTLAFFKNGTEL